MFMVIRCNIKFDVDKNHAVTNSPNLSDTIFTFGLILIFSAFHHLNNLVSSISQILILPHYFTFSHMWWLRYMVWCRFMMWLQFVEWLRNLSSWRGARLIKSHAARAKSEFSGCPGVPVILEDCLQTAFVLDISASCATLPLPVQRVPEQAFEACIHLLRYWKWLVNNAPSHDASKQGVTIDLTLFQAVTDTLR